MKERINVNYIGVVCTESDNGVLYKHIPIENNYLELMSKLEDMAKNENRTVLDMQVYFEESFPKNICTKWYNYCHPYAYNSSYIDGVRYPKLYSYSEYQDIIKEIRTEESKRDKARELRSVFAQRCHRYIEAFCYNNQISQLQRSENCKMYSTETIGWTNYSYKINEDIEIQLSSNFGFGSASYFIVGLTYKGIEILPYSMVVNYYNAYMADIMRYTRKYYVESGSWDMALDFVATTANNANQNPGEFVSKWIVNEVEEMLSGIRRIAKDPTSCFKNLMKSVPLNNLLLVRNISDYEIKRYKIYPHEMVIAKQAEKISGAMMLLEKLEILTTIYPKVVEAINEIKGISNSLIPNFKAKVSQIEEQIAQKQEELNSLMTTKESIELECKPDFDEINKMTELKTKETGKYVAEYIIRQEYEQIHPDFKIKFEKIQELSKKISNIQSDIYNRESFSSEISNCINIIESKLQLTA